MDMNRNSGNWNSGDRNSGNWNSGDRNSGNRNSGNWNSGYRNSGNWNSGDRNSGDRNSGNRNSGNWNSGNYHTGCFNTDVAQKAYYFNVLLDVIDWKNASKPSFLYDISPTTFIMESDMSDAEKVANPTFHITGGYLRENDIKEEWQKAWDNATPEDRELLFKLPAFNADVFKEITGVDVGSYDTCDGKVVEVDGKKYKLMEIKE